jgi:hypothetical protein
MHVRYLLLICGDEQAFNGLPEHEAVKRTADWVTYTNELLTTNKLRGGERLRPVSSATTVRLQAGQRLLSDGPFAETKEQLGGFYLVDVEDLDEAVAWASKMPHLVDGGSVDIRPIWEIG